MSASYWQSTQCRFWTFTKEQLATMRQKLEEDNAELVRMFPLPQQRHLNIYFNQQLIRLAKRLTIRQQSMATAQVYMKRFYSKVEIRRTNPYLVIATAIYLACKIEESPQHIRLIVTEARQMWGDLVAIDTSKLGECEFFMISEMRSQLIVYQPYRTVIALRSELGLQEDEVQLARSVINDHFMTDLPLLYPPHVIAMVAMLLALVLRPNNSGPGQNASGAAAAAGLAAAQQALMRAQGQQTPGGGATDAATAEPKERQQQARVSRVQKFAKWLVDSNVDIASMVDATQEIISFYECYEHYNDKLTREQINRFVKARGLDK
ncbi:rna polymerase ii holoenzyme cyclinlike subunit [Fusarium sporotrichioides]|uniref:RNA polymerase II holoenzyme cyclin-like subunit n=1 Tax=Fusarium sporotrichioides TaxID=5514 RepID=A0A395SLP3_FUSSP|nr:rna polymerase ii holoenzyme cyclinlike subunit [Fusarium sporotrichioides]